MVILRGGSLFYPQVFSFKALGIALVCMRAVFVWLNEAEHVSYSGTFPSVRRRTHANRLKAAATITLHFLKKPVPARGVQYISYVIIS